MVPGPFHNFFLSLIKNILWIVDLLGPIHEDMKSRDFARDLFIAQEIE
jgi:hypothetical protein